MDTALSIGTEASFSQRLITRVAALLGIVIVSGILLLLNYWLGVTFFFLALLPFISFTFNKYEGRGLLLLLTLSLFVGIIAGSLAEPWVSTNVLNGQATQNDEVTIFLISTIIGVITALTLVIIPFLVIVGVSTAGVLKWHKNDDDISFFDAFWHLLTDLLGILHFMVTVDEGKPQGSEQDLARLKYVGGPGWLIVYPGYVVVLHTGGKITRVVGLGWTMLDRYEKIRAIIPLANQGGVNTIEHVLTRDKIPLTLTVLHVAQMEPASNTESRLQQSLTDAETRLKISDEKKGALQKEITNTAARLKTLTNAQEITNTEARLKTLTDTKNVLSEDMKATHQNIKDAKQGLQDLEKDASLGDDYDKCYESIARRVAIKAPNVWEAMKSSVANNIKDVIMSCDFDELFNIGDHTEGFAVSVDNRKIAEIEETVFERSAGSGLSKGVILKVVDINEVHFPEEIKEKIVGEANALVEERIERIKARTKEATAQTKARITQIEADARTVDITTKAKGDQTATETEALTLRDRAIAEGEAEIIRGRAKAQAEVIRARATAEAEALRGRGKAEAKAEYYRQVLQVLRGQSTDETIDAVLRNLTSSISLEDEINQIKQLLFRQERIEEGYRRNLPRIIRDQGDDDIE